MLSCEYCELFKNIYFEEHLRTAASPCRHQQQWRTTFARETRRNWVRYNVLCLFVSIWYYYYCILSRSSRTEVFFKKLFLKILKNLQDENTCARVSFEAPLATSLKWRRRHRCFPVNFCEIFKNIPPPLAASFYHKMLNIKIHRDSYMQ